MDNGLPPLEFTDCVVDSPFFRENLHIHEKELERTSQQIKRLIKDVKDLLNAAKSKFPSEFFFSIGCLSSGNQVLFCWHC